MKRFLVVSLSFLLTLAVDAQQIQRHLRQEPLAENLAESTIHRIENRGEVIIELDAEPLLGRETSSSTRTSELDSMFERLEKDLRAIELDLAGPLSVRGIPEASGIHHRYTRTFAGASATVHPDSIAAIRALSYVRAVHPDRGVRAYLEDSVAQVGASEVWSTHGNRGAGVVVAIIDSGVDYGHPSLGGGIGPGFKVIGGRDFVNDDDDPMDDAGHGTHVAGIVAANGGGLLGVAPEASLLAYKVLDEIGSGRDSWVLAGIEAAIAEGADVVNMSLGRPAFPDDPVIKAVEKGFAAGVVFCVAAGNSGRFLDIGSPGRAPNAITVGALDRDGHLASFSSKGPVVPTGAIKPEISAPGVSIRSAVPGGGFEAYSGTSMASPHVAGVVALVRSLHPEWSARRVRTAVIDAAGPIDEEVVAGGAGSLFAPDAVAADLFASPSELSFGIAEGGSEPLIKNLYLTNRSDAAITVSLDITGNREGIELRGSDTEIEIAPGEVGRIDLELWIDHDLVEAPREGSLSFGGSIRVHGSSGSVRVPWSVTKASKIRVRWTGSESATVRLGTDAMMTQGWISGDSATTDMIIGAGPAILWLHAGEVSPSSAHHVFLENLDLSAITELTLGPEDAPHRIRFLGRDIHGRPLFDRSERSLAEIVFLHPQLTGTLLDVITFVGPEQEIFVSPASEALQFQTFQRAFDIEERTSWSISYPMVRGIDGDVDLMFDSTRWVELPIRFSPPRGLTDAGESIFTTAWVSRGRETLSSMAAPIAEPGSQELSDAWAWLAPARDDAGVGSLIDIGATQGGPGIIAEFHAVENGLVPGIAPVSRLSDRVIPSGEPVTIGPGPAFPSSFIGSVDGFLIASMMWFGPHRELRFHDSSRTRGTISDGEGKVLVSREPSPGSMSFGMSADLPGEGTYRFEASTDSFEVAGVPVDATLTSTFDTRKEDWFPPVMTSMRLADGAGRADAVFVAGSAPTLHFSAFDLRGDGYGPPAGEKTRVEYRRHVSSRGTQNLWTALSAVEIGDDLDAEPRMGGPDGLLYRVDLTEIAATLSGPVDLRLIVEDPAGNSISYTLEPGLMIDDGGRRRAVRRR